MFYVVFQTLEHQFKSTNKKTFFVTAANEAELCDRSVCHSVDRITAEHGNRRRPNLADMGKG